MHDDPDRTDAWQELQQTAWLLRTQLSKRSEEQAGMTATEHDILWCLANDPDRRMTMTDLAERAMITRSGATRLVERLERQGWVSRETLPENRRATYVVLTEDGVAAVRASTQAMFHNRRELFDERLTDTDVSQLRSILAKLMRRLDLAD